jgi:hypothetical protein
VRRWNFAFQKGSAQGTWQSAGSIGWKGAEQRTSRRHPGKRPLEDADDEFALVQIAYRESKERAISDQIGAEQDGGGFDAGNLQDLLKVSRRHVHHGNCFAHERQRRRQPLESLGSARDCQVAGRSPRGGSQLGQVHRQPLLQLAGTTRGDQSRPRRSTTEVNQEAGTIRLRPRAGERRGSRPRSPRVANRRDENHSPVHCSAGLA